MQLMVFGIVFLSNQAGVVSFAERGIVEVNSESAQRPTGLLGQQGCDN